jgi:type II secretory pathway pseudopilin PulG
VDRRGFSLIDVLVAISLFTLVGGLSLLALYKVEGTRRAYAKEAVIRQVLFWYAGRQEISSSFPWHTTRDRLSTTSSSLSDPSDPIAPLVARIQSYYPHYHNQVFAVLDSAPAGNTYTVSTTPSGGYLLETRTNRIALQLDNGPYVFTLGNDLFSYEGQVPLKSFVAVP